MLLLGVDLGYTEVELVLRAAILEIRIQQNKLAEPGPNDEAALVQVRRLTTLK